MPLLSPRLGPLDRELERQKDRDGDRDGHQLQAVVEKAGPTAPPPEDPA